MNSRQSKWTLFLLLNLACFFASNLSFAQTGSLDVNFGIAGIVKTDIDNGNDYGFSIAQQSDGKIIVAGIARVDTTNNNFGLMRYNINGSLDSTFGINGIVTTDIQPNADDAAQSVCIQNDGKIIVAGRSAASSSPYDIALARYTIDGNLDSTFDIDGIVTTDIAGYNDFGSSVKMKSDGKIVVVAYTFDGTNTGLAVLRYNSNGSLDTTFDTDGIAITYTGNIYLDGQSVGIQSDGKIVAVATTILAGNNYDYLVVRYNTNGTLDTSFDGDGIVTTDVCYKDYAYSVAIQTDGKIVVAGSSTDTITSISGRCFSLVRYNSNGSLDTTFDGDGKVFTKITNLADKAYSVAIQSNGKIIAVGNSADGVSDFKIAMVCYNTDGSLDNSFGNGGMVTTNIASEHEYGESVLIQHDGKIIITGFIRDGATFDIFVARYLGEAPLFIQNNYSVPSITLYPNPCSTKIMLQSEIMVKDAVATVYNMFGQKVKQIKNISGSSCLIYLDDLASGFYLFYLTMNDIVLAKEKIIISANE